MNSAPITYRSHHFPPDSSVRYASKGTPAKYLLFLGVGQSGANLSAIIDAMPVDSAVVEAFPYHKTPLESMGEVSTDTVISLIKSLSGGLPCRVIAESQATPAVVLAASARPELIQSLTLLEPLGFNRDALGETPDQRYRSLMRRSRRFWRHPNQSLRIKANRDTLLEITKRSLLALHRLRPDYTFGASQDVVNEAKKLAGLLPVTIYADKNDGLFPYDEIAPNIAGSQIVLQEVHGGSHLNRATPKGIAELRSVLTSLRG